MMRVYFAGSITGGRADAALYQHILQYVTTLGWTVLTEHIGSENLGVTGEAQTVQYIYERDMAWIAEADVLIAEVTTPSPGVGYEIAQAETLGTPILRLFRPSPRRRLSAMIAGAPGVTVHEYTDNTELETIIATFLAQYETPAKS